MSSDELNSPDFILRNLFKKLFYSIVSCFEELSIQYSLIALKIPDFSRFDFKKMSLNFDPVS